MTTHLYVPWLIHTRNMTHSPANHVWNHSQICLTWLVYVSHTPCTSQYGVATVSRIDKIRSLFCKRALLKRRYSAKETYNSIDPTDRSHPIPESNSVTELWHKCMIALIYGRGVRRYTSFPPFRTVDLLAGNSDPSSLDNWRETLIMNCDMTHTFVWHNQ